MFQCGYFTQSFDINKFIKKRQLNYLSNLIVIFNTVYNQAYFNYLRRGIVMTRWK
jgi:hypothetical protein